MKTPKRLKGMQSASHARSRNQERELARQLKGRVTKGSGNGDEKGDIRVHGLCRIEAKTTKHKSFSVTREMLAKIEEAALTCNELPAMVIEFLGDDGKPQGSVAVVPMWGLTTLIDQARDNRDDRRTSP